MSFVPDIYIRRARPEDARACAEINLLGWRTAYAGLIADDTLEKMNLQDLLGKWNWRLTNKEKDTFCYVSLCPDKDGNEEVTGYILAGPNRNKTMPFTHEVLALYLRPEYKRQGIGRLLFRTAIEEFKRMDVSSMLVFVLEGNDPARQFYSSFGPVFTKNTTLGIDGRTYNESAFGWTDILEL
jgi:ribosomal protein S18 acetylase RimI-like enzyme